MVKISRIIDKIRHLFVQSQTNEMILEIFEAFRVSPPPFNRGGLKELTESLEKQEIDS